jgi:protease-4
MSAEAREMTDWLIDDVYCQLVGAIAGGRGITEEEAKALIDGGPYMGGQSVDAGAADAVIGEEDLPIHLAHNGKPARLSPYASVRRHLLALPVHRPGRYVALLRIAGDIVDGRSAQPPVKPPFQVPLILNERTGDLTVVQEARTLLCDRRAAAVVVHVDSGGGSATASEAMAAALKKVAEKKPLVVSMSSVAASGGYYVATPGQWIMAEPATLTGSIGVLSGKLVSGGLFEKLLFHREIISRGRRAKFFGGSQPFNEEERKCVQQLITQTYELFLERVCASRELSRDAVDAVGGGRVWTGRQALEHGLIDEFGGLERALDKARQLAGLSRLARVREVKVGKKETAPIPDSKNAFEYAFDGLRVLQRASALCLCPLVLWKDVF